MAGDVLEGRTLPAYRELARVLEPWLYEERFAWGGFSRITRHVPHRNWSRGRHSGYCPVRVRPSTEDVCRLRAGYRPQ
jgi:hypothetical protein